MNKILLGVCIGLSTFYTIDSAYAIDAKYRVKLEHSGCTQVSELQGCDVNKTKADNAKAGFGASTSTHFNTYAGEWIAKNSNTGQTIATIRVDRNENVWINGQKAKAKRSDGGLIFKKGLITYKLEGDPTQQNQSSWNDSDAKTTGPILKK
ncbi:hypothetical protein [Acinetobacter tjernbergiae]|uniref:Uncharacterized protein n=1 Tax=Acinetobacter tjernbergiae DSM 14971 = CIP 107465 TaxID=1120928 RepID=V2V008_9GAMM|nr:hypothetical protein [Acinetobacter tjernbergiae]ESK55607.1 hypothetical protein F990_01721 [Acinetobacter tjernbergiae DSM 14971 = CIP 107465]